MNNIDALSSTRSSGISIAMIVLYEDISAYITSLQMCVYFKIKRIPLFTDNAVIGAICTKHAILRLYLRFSLFRYQRVN